MKQSTQAALMALADGVTLDEMLEEAALRMIEYTQEERLVSFSRVGNRLVGYEQI